MLVLTRRPGQAIVADGVRLSVVSVNHDSVTLRVGDDTVTLPLRYELKFDRFTVILDSINRVAAKLAFDAPREVKIYRAEVLGI